MRIEGAAELAAEFAAKARTVDGDVFKAMWGLADEGAASAASLAPKGVPELAPSMSAGTFKIPGGVRAVWGPTARHGIFVERGTYKMQPQPYLSPSFDRVAPKADGVLGKLLDL